VAGHDDEPASTTRDLYAYLLRRFLLPTFGKASLSSIDVLAVRAWLASLQAEQLSPSTVAKAYRLLSRILGAAAEPGPDGLVFPAPEGGYLRRSNFRRRWWLRATRAAGVEGLRFHTSVTRPPPSPWLPARTPAS
jgi:hypothetical protein